MYYRLTLDNTPAAGLLAALCTGIVVATVCTSIWVAVGFAIAGTTIFIYRRLRFKAPYDIAVSTAWAQWQIWGFVAALGAFSAAVNHPGDPYTDYNNFTHIQGRVIQIDSRTSSDRYIIEATGVRNVNDGSAIATTPFRFYLYTSAYAPAFGDLIELPMVLEKNGHNMNYIHTEAPESIFPSMRPQHFIYAAEGDLKILEHDPTSLRTLPFRLREMLIVTLEQSKLSRNSKQLLSAMLLADDYMLTPDTREAFSRAGIAHILAVSGLHVGIISGIALLLLWPLRLCKLNRYRYLLAILLIWVYVLICGAPSSGLRAALMISLCLVAVMLEREHNSLNALCAAAFLILALSPMQLFNPSMQFSFTAVFALITLVPAVQLQVANNRSLQWLLSSICATIVASVATWGLTACWYGEVQLLFLPTNMAILPFLPLYIGCGILYILLASCGVQPYLLSRIIDTGTDCITNVSEYVAGSSAASAELSIGPLSTLLFFLFLVSLALCVINRRRVYIYSSGVIACLTALSIMLLPAADHCRAYGFIITDNRYSVQIRRYTDGADTLIELPTGATCSTNIQDHKLLSVCTPIRKSSDSITSCDILIIGNGFRGKTENLVAQTNPHLIVLSTGLYVHQAEKIEEDCRRLSIPCHNITTHGPYRALTQE